MILSLKKFNETRKIKNSDVWVKFKVWSEFDFVYVNGLNHFNEIQYQFHMPLKEYSSSYLSSVLEKICSNEQFRNKCFFNKNIIRNQDEIDPKLKKVIQRLNQIGVKTKYSCQGTSHNFSPFPNNRDSHGLDGYIELERGNSFPADLVVMLKKANMFVGQSIIRSNHVLGREAECNDKFQRLLNDWVEGSLDISGMKYRISKKEVKILPPL